MLQWYPETSEVIPVPEMLYHWKVTHRLEISADNTVLREENGIARAESREAAESILEKLVCTVFTTELAVTEIPDKIAVYSFGYTDTKVK